GLREYSSAIVTDEEVRALRSRVRVKLASELPRGAARVEMMLRGGRTMSATILTARGGTEHPPSDADIEAKVRTLAADVPSSDPEAIIDAIWHLDAAADIHSLMALAGRAASAANQA